MGVTPSLPPYAHIDQEAVRCIAQASIVYQVPELLLHSVLVKEGGRTGKCVRNANGTYDCGLSQINTAWSQHLEQRGVSWARVQNEACTNIYVAAYILRTNQVKKNGDWFSAIVSYNIGPNNWTPQRYSIGYRYAADVVSLWRGFQAWVDANNPSAMSSSRRPQHQGKSPLVFNAPSNE